MSQCEDDPAWLCGSVPVPLDRARPQGRTVPIAFEILPHSGPGAGRPDPVVITQGGPGGSATADRYFLAFVVEALQGTRDVVLIDNRGTGKSAALLCPTLQDGVADLRSFLRSTAQCGRRLGDDADRYGTGDIALDIEAVRRALGYPRLNYFANSYASVAAQAYAVRFPQRLRSIVIDAGVPVNDPAHIWAWGPHVPDAIERRATLACLRAPACAAGHPDARTAVADLAARVRRAPVTGTARDFYNVLRRVRVGERELAALAGFGSWLNSGEMAAAEDALAAGDPQPLLRMAAESPVWPGEGESEDPRFFSEGAAVATYCNDQDFVWNRTDPLGVRARKYLRSASAFPRDEWAPFTRRAWNEFYTPATCIGWPAPDRFVPAVPRGATVTDVPTLLLVGDLDVIVPAENTRALLGVFPEAVFVRLAGADHTTVGWSQCARTLTTRWMRSLATGDRSCARQPSFVGAAVERFPLTAADAPPGTALPGNGATRRDRQIATVAVRTVQDAWLRSFRNPEAVDTVPGLRGGTATFDYASSPDLAVVDLAGARFARDVSVAGSTSLGYADSVLTMTIEVDGPGERDGSLRARGRWRAGEGVGDPPFQPFTVTGDIGGRSVAVRVPAN